MVAEAIPEQEEAKAAAVIPDAPESTPEPTTEPEDNTEIDSVLEGLLDESASDAATGSTGTGDSPSNPLEGLTPEQIEQRGAEKERERLIRQADTTNRQAREEGMVRSLGTVKTSIKDMITPYLDADTVISVLNKVDEMHGTHLALRQGDVDRVAPQLREQQDQQTQATVAQLLYDTVQKDLGDASVKALQTAGAKTWDDFAKAIGKEYRKGYISNDKAKENLRGFAKKIDTALKERGSSLAEITGTGGVSLPTPRGGTGGQPKDYAEAEAWHASGKWSNAEMRRYTATHSRN